MKKTNNDSYSNDKSVSEDPRFHNTWKLLKSYRDVTWSLELSVQQARQQFSLEFGSSIEDFLDSVYLAGADLAGTDIEYQARCIERSHKMLRLLQTSIDLLRTKHKHGEDYYWILYYTYLSTQEPSTVVDIIDTLQKQIENISYRTYYRMRKEAIRSLSSILWGYSSQECLGILDNFFPDK